MSASFSFPESACLREETPPIPMRFFRADDTAPRAWKMAAKWTQHLPSPSQAWNFVSSLLAPSSSHKTPWYRSWQLRKRDTSPRKCRHLWRVPPWVPAGCEHARETRGRPPEIPSCSCGLSRNRGQRQVRRFSPKATLDLHSLMNR